MPKRKYSPDDEDIDSTMAAKKSRNIDDADNSDSDSDSDNSSSSSSDSDDSSTSSPSLSSSSDVNAKMGDAGSSSSSSSSSSGGRSQSDERKHTSDSCSPTPTVTIALPGSVIANAQGLELKTWLAGQIARALTIFKVDEVVIFSEDGAEIGAGGSRPGDEKYRSDANMFLYRLLRYLETPPYLRRALFPMHQDLRYAGALSPLDAPHHQNTLANSRFREGIVAEWDSLDVIVNAGLGDPVTVTFEDTIGCPRPPSEGERVTVEIDESEPGAALRGHIVPPARPRNATGVHWGYATRLACGIGEVFENCPYEGGYDLSLGTSERGELAQTPNFSLPKFRHLVIFIGGPKGLENCALHEGKPMSMPTETFDRYLNVCANQGSGTIRTEEALLVIMSVLHPHIEANRS